MSSFVGLAKRFISMLSELGRGRHQMNLVAVETLRSLGYSEDSEEIQYALEAGPARHNMVLGIPEKDQPRSITDYVVFCIARCSGGFKKPVDKGNNAGVDINAVRDPRYSQWLWVNAGIDLRGDTQAERYQKYMASGLPVIYRVYGKAKNVKPIGNVFEIR